MTAFNMIAAQARSIFASSYIRAVGKLSSGQFVAAAIPFLAAPILGRLYLPADYGVLATYMATAGLFTTFSTLQLHHGIIAEKSDRRAEALVRICFWVAGFIALLSIGAAGLIFLGVERYPEFAAHAGWLLLLPVSTFAGGATMGIATLANRRQSYGSLAWIQVLGVLVSVPVSIGLGFLGWGANGLFVAYFLSQAITAVAYWRIYTSLDVGPVRIQPSRLRAIAYRHRRFSFYTLPSEFLSTFNLNMPVYALSAMGAFPLLGAYSRAMRLVALPATLVGQSITMVFRQRGSQEYHKTGSCQPIFIKTLLGLLAIGLFPTLVLIVFAPEIFVIFLGPKWVEAGHIAQILAPMLLFRIVGSPLTAVFFFTGNQRIAFYMQIVTAAIFSVVVIGIILTDASAVTVVYGYTFGYSIFYLVSTSLAWNMARQRGPY